MSEIKLTPKQQRFCDEYLKDLNGARAAIAAGYSEKSAKEIASETLTKPNVKAYIEARMEKHKEKDVADQEEILRLLTDIARGKTKSATLMGVGGGAEIIEEEMPPTTAERIKAAELIGKRYAMWTDKQEVNAVITPVFVDDIGADDE